MYKMATVSMLSCILFILIYFISPNQGKVTCYHSYNSDESVYNYRLMDIHKRRWISLSKYRNKVMAIVNVASF